MYGLFTSGSIYDYNFISGWPSFVAGMTKAWLAFHLDWLSFDGDLQVIQYEDLCSDFNSSLTQITHFFNISISGKLRECVINNANGMFKRPKKDIIDFDPFSKSMRESIEKSKNKVALAIQIKLNETTARTF